MKHLFVTIVLAGCADRIGPPPNESPDGPPPMVIDDSTAIVDASSMTAWTFIDVESFTATDESGPWALRFQRFHISTGEGTEVAPLAEPFDAVTTVPSSGWLHDEDTDGNGTLDYAFDQGDTWYDYNPETHVLTPKPLTWIVRAPSTTLKLRFENYYDTAGTAGWFTVTWRPL